MTWFADSEIYDGKSQKRVAFVLATLTCLSSIIFGIAALWFTSIQMRSQAEIERKNRLDAEAQIVAQSEVDKQAKLQTEVLPLLAFLAANDRLLSDVAELPPADHGKEFAHKLWDSAWKLRQQASRLRANALYRSTIVASRAPSVVVPYANSLPSMEELKITFAGEGKIKSVDLADAVEFLGELCVIAGGSEYYGGAAKPRSNPFKYTNPTWGHDDSEVWMLQDPTSNKSTKFRFDISPSTKRIWSIYLLPYDKLSWDDLGGLHKERLADVVRHMNATLADHILSKHPSLTVQYLDMTKK